MCIKCDNIINHNRRNMMINAAGFAAAMGAFPNTLFAAEAKNLKAEQVTAYSFASATSGAKPMKINRRSVGDNDVKMDILYSGICHSDLHGVHGDWRPATYPIVPGHEIIGRVVAVGKNVTRFKIGDIGGVGCMVDSCGYCENCKNNREQNCLNGTTFTYSSPDKISGGLTYGGYSNKIVVKDSFVVNIPKGLDITRAAPIMCAGITTFSPMQHWKLEKGQKVGVIGIGGLGHMAVKLAIARGAEVIAFTTSPSKIPYIKSMGAKDVVLWSDKDAISKLQNYFDLMIATVPEEFNIQDFMNLLKLDATLVNVGMLGNYTDKSGLSGMVNGFGRKSLAGSMIGGIAETQEVINYCAEHNILPDVEIIKPNQIDAAWERIKNKDIKFRFVIDMQAA